MTFDIAQMIADREAGTPGLWFVAGVRVKMDEQQWIAISRYDEASKRDENICCAGYDPKTGLGSTDARRIARVPLLEAEIIRLTARVAELEGDAAEFRSAAMWTKHAAEVLDGYEADYGEFLPLTYEIGRIPDSRKTASFRIYPNHIRGLADLLKPRAALSTHTEEPKT